MTWIAHYPSPLGELTLLSDGQALTGLHFAGQRLSGAILDEKAAEQPALPIFAETALWLDAYFGESPLPPMPPLHPEGTPFQKAVWEALLAIPYGMTRTYGEVAEALRFQGLTGSARAVGGAVGRNPIAILIPCHRVLGADGSLTGYAGGLEKKRFLLELERADESCCFLSEQAVYAQFQHL